MHCLLTSKNIYIVQFFTISYHIYWLSTHLLPRLVIDECWAILGIILLFHWQQILLPLTGRLPAGTVYDDIKEESAEDLEDMFKNSEPDRMIHLVVHVHAAPDALQENLIKALSMVARDRSRCKSVIFARCSKISLNPKYICRWHIC